MENRVVCPGPVAHARAGTATAAVPGMLILGSNMGEFAGSVNYGLSGNIAS